MWAYWGSKIDKKSDTIDAYWGSFLSVWEVSRTVTGVSKVTYWGNKDNKCGLTGGQKLIKSRTLWVLSGGHSSVFGG